MDETRFVSEFYLQQKKRDFEVIALAYEYSTDTARSRKSLEKFKERFNITYLILITGVTSTDPDRTSKTLPQFEKIESFPTTIFLDKSGKVYRVHTGFSGPATGIHYEEDKKYFYTIVDQLLND